MFCFGELPRLLDADAQAIEGLALILTGEKADAGAKHMNRRFAALLPDAKEAEIRRASHLMHEDRPEKVFE